MEAQTDILNPEELIINLPRRKKLLPWWVKIFTWIFMVFGAIASVMLIMAMLGSSFEIALYGLETNDPNSFIGYLLIAIFLLKGFSAFSLWMEKDWAIDLGFTDAILGIVICGYLTIGAPFLSTGHNMNLRLELILLIPYLLWLKKIKPVWRESNKA